MIIKIANSVLLLLLFTLYSCFLPDSGPRLYDLIEVQNETDFPVLVQAYRKGKIVPNIEKSKTIEIDANATKLVFSEYIRGAVKLLYSSGQEVDSMVIKFGDKRQLIQYCGGNMLGTCSDQNESILLNRFNTERIDGKIDRKRVWEKKIFRITKSDFDRATEL